MMALNWMFSQRVTNTNITRVDPKNLLLRYKYPFTEYETTQQEDIHLEENLRKVEQ